MPRGGGRVPPILAYGGGVVFGLTGSSSSRFSSPLLLPFSLHSSFAIPFTMLSAIFPDAPALPKWERPKKTSVDLDWAEISVVDISSFDAPGGKEKLADELRHAVRKSEICR